MKKKEFGAKSRVAKKWEERTMQLRILVYHKGGAMIARSLEFDYAAQGKDVASALEAFKRGVVGMSCLADHLKIKNPFGHLPPAPQIFHDKWSKAKRLEDPLIISAPVSYSMQWDGDHKTEGSVETKIAKAVCAVE